jgi:hypothetical protein
VEVGRVFKSPKLFFIYLAWFVGIVLIIYGVFNLVFGLLYLAVPETQKTFSIGPFGFDFMMFDPMMEIEEEMMLQEEDPMFYMPPHYQIYLEEPERLEKLSPEERKKFDEAYAKAEKKLERAKKEIRERREKWREEYSKGLIPITLAKGIVGLFLGIPLALITWNIGKREKEIEVQASE